MRLISGVIGLLMAVLFPISSIGVWNAPWLRQQTGATSGPTSGSTGAVAGSGSMTADGQAADGQTISGQQSSSAANMPNNPSQRLPSTVNQSIPDSATVVSGNLAVLKNGEVKNLSTGSTVTNPKIVGTAAAQPDPLAKTNGVSFIPTSVQTVRAKIQQDGKRAASGVVRQSDYIPDRSQVISADWGSNEYGAYWGSYNGSQSFFGASGDLFAQQASHVIDVSQWQGTVDWTRAKAAGVQGAIIRIGFGWGNDFDTQALRNISECKRLGIPFGIYLYSYAYDAQTAADEGSDIVGKLRAAGVSPSDLSYPIFYDFENWSWAGHAPPTSPSVYEGMVSAWYARLQAAGYSNLGVYSYVDYLRHALNSSFLHAKTRWVADYGSEMPFQFSTNDRGWQYSDQAKVDGISGTVDVSAFGYAQYHAAVDVTRYPSVPISNGDYYINSFALDSSGIDMPGGSTNDGARPQLYQANGTAAQQYIFTRQPNGSYVVINVHSGKALDVAGANAGDGAVVQQWDPNGTQAQQWYVRDSGAGYYLQSALGNWVLDLARGGLSNGTSAWLYAPNGTVTQKFLLSSASTDVPTDAPVSISSALNTALNVDLIGGSASSGTRFQLYPWNRTNAQLYTFHSVGNGVYQIVDVASGKNLEVGYGATSNGGIIRQWDGNGTPAQHWSLMSYGANTVTFVNDASGKAIDVPAANASTGTLLQSFTVNGTPAQRWSVTPQHDAWQLNMLAAAHPNDLADGTLTLGTALSQQMVADVAGGSSSNGAQVRLWASNGTNAQRWVVSHDSYGGTSCSPTWGPERCLTLPEGPPPMALPSTSTPPTARSLKNGLRCVRQTGL